MAFCSSRGHLCIGFIDCLSFLFPFLTQWAWVGGWNFAPCFYQYLNPLIGFDITKNTLLLDVTCPSSSSIWIDFISALFNVTISWSWSSSHLSGMTTSSSPPPASGKTTWSWNSTHFFFFLGVSSDILAISLLVSNSSWKNEENVNETQNMRWL